MSSSFLLLVAAASALIGQSNAGIGPLEDILRADELFLQLPVDSRSSLQEIRATVSKLVKESPKDQLPNTITRLESLWTSKDCTAPNLALRYSELIKENKYISSSVLRLFAESAATEYTSYCADSLSKNNWRRFEEALRSQLSSGEPDLVDQIMANHYAGKENFADAKLYDRFASDIISAVDERRMPLERATKQISHFCYVARNLFKNMGNLDPNGQLTTRIKNFFIAQKLWMDMERSRDVRFARFFDGLDEEAREQLGEMVRGPNMGTGIRALVKRLSIPNRQVREKLENLCKPIDRREHTIIKFIDRLRLWPPRKSFIFRFNVAKMCAEVNFGSK